MIREELLREGFKLFWSERLDQLQAAEQGLLDRDPMIRAQAARTLGEIRADEAYDRLRQSMGDEAPEVRAAALQAMADILPEETREAAKQRLWDDDARVRHAAAQALGVVPAAIERIRVAAKEAGSLFVEAVVFQTPQLAANEKFGTVRPALFRYQLSGGDEDITVVLREDNQGQLILAAESSKQGFAGSVVAIDIEGDGEPLVEMIELEASPIGCYGVRVLGDYATSRRRIGEKPKITRLRLTYPS